MKGRKTKQETPYLPHVAVAQIPSNKSHAFFSKTSSIEAKEGNLSKDWLKRVWEKSGRQRADRVKEVINNSCSHE
jgi:hypothetical protein